jgi:DNA-binding beta-propeller fold protein YncE
MRRQAMVVGGLWPLLLAVGSFAQNPKTDALKIEKTIPTLADTTVQFAAVSPKGDLVAGACKDGRVRLWSLPGAELKQAFDLRDQRISTLVFSSDGGLLAVGGSRGGVKVWSVPSGKVRGEFVVSARVDTLAISPDGQLIAIAPSEAPAEIWDLKAGRISDLPTKFSGVLALAFSPDGRLLASADADTEIHFYEAQTGAPRGTYSDLLLETFGITFSADGKYLFVGGADKTISVVDTASAKAVRAFPKQSFVVSGLQLSRDGMSLAAVYSDERNSRTPAPVLIWDVAAQSVRTTVLQTGVMPNGGGFLSDGRLLITSSSDNKFQVWSTR